ncbi:PAS domain S-box protein [Natronorarus salvus]|uniref:PAS domain S-box protein n=1 Tax=Natronorarus salvus TaxID=3117733 RepID=UPI002F2662B3
MRDAGHDGISVLHVDDDAAFASLTATYLERIDAGLSVRSETSVETAVDRLSSTAVDCVVSDYEMPEATGIDFLDRVRELDATLPFVLYTGRGSEEVASEAISAGVTDYVRKGGGTAQYEVLANRIRNAVERHRAERSLSESERRHERLIEASPASIVILDAGGTIRYANESAATLVGADEGAELVGRDGLSFVHPDDRARSEERIRRVLARDEVAPRTETRLLTLDGDVLYATIATAPVRFRGEPAGQVVLTDVTARREREEALRTRAAVMNTALDGLALLSGETFVEVNRAHARIYGYERPEELVGTSWKRLYAEREADRIEHEVLPTLDEEGGWRGEATGRRRDGSGFPQSLSLSLTDDGEIVCAVRDVTEQHDRERTLGVLHEATRRLMRAGDRGEVARITTDAASDVLGFPLCSVRWYDAERDTLVPAAVTDEARTLLGPIEPFERGESLSWETFDTGEPSVFEDIREHDAALHATTGVRTMLKLSLGEHGLLTMASRTADDVTDADVFLARVLAANAEAALDRAERERQLRERECELTRQNERLDEFASLLAHDIRNPLNVATGHLDLARRERESDHLDRVASAHDRMAALVEDVLSLAREGGRIEAPEPVDLARTAERAWANVEIGETTLETTCSRPVLGDTRRLERLFENLFRNAVEHAGEEVTVRVGDLPDGFFVADDGPGVPEDVVEDLFEPGITASPTGTGFGLAIVEEIAEAHGWSVTLRESASGARFEVRGVHDATADTDG